MSSSSSQRSFVLYAGAAESGPQGEGARAAGAFPAHGALGSGPGSICCHTCLHVLEQLNSLYCMQVLLSQVHRLRALVLLGRFLDMGRWAVDLALSVGIFPYVLKLLQTTAPDLRQTLVFIWTKILALDRSCQASSFATASWFYCACADLLCLCGACSIAALVLAKSKMYTTSPVQQMPGDSKESV